MLSEHLTLVRDGKITTLYDYASLFARRLKIFADLPPDTPVPREIKLDLAPYDRAVEEAEQRVADIVALTPSECWKRSQADYEQARAGYDFRAADRIKWRKRYVGAIK